MVYAAIDKHLALPFDAPMHSSTLNIAILLLLLNVTNNVAMYSYDTNFPLIIATITMLNNYYPVYQGQKSHLYLILIPCSFDHQFLRIVQLDK